MVFSVGQCKDYPCTTGPVAELTGAQHIAVGAHRWCVAIAFVVGKVNPGL
jgi:hypothetical protein